MPEQTDKTSVGDVLCAVCSISHTGVLCKIKEKNKCNTLKQALRKLGEMIEGAIEGSNKIHTVGERMKHIDKTCLIENLTDIGLMGEGKGE